MEALLLECAVRAALIAIGTATVLWAMRIKSAVIRHAAWTAVVVAMLLLPIWSLVGPRLALRVLRPAATQSVANDAPAPTAPAIPSAPLEPAIPTTAAPVATRRFDWLDMLAAVYALGAFVLLARLVAGTVLAQRLRRSVVMESGIATSKWCATPITVGWLAPLAVLPAGWTEWPAPQLRAVLTHEGEHVRRRDPLVQWLALLNRAVFWFHPLAWWLERRLSALAEEACDAAVLAAGHSPQDYSQYLLDLARSVAGQRRRVHIGMAMAEGGLRDRMRNIFDAVPAPRASRARVICAIAFCATSSALFAAGTLAPVPQASKPATVTAQKFDVVSIKTCDASAIPANRPGPTHIDTSANRFFIECATAEVLLNLAYVRDGDFVLNQHDLDSVVRGGPDWMRSDRYTIEATTHGEPPASVVEGSMLRALLEERFEVRTHALSEQIPMYGLTVAKDGLKIKPIAKGDCVDEDEQDALPPLSGVSAARGHKPFCGMVHGQDRNGIRNWDIGGGSIGSLAAVLETDRPVLDQTGVKDRFNIHLEYALEDATGRQRADTGTPTVFGALEQQLGLKLVSTKGPRKYFVVDHIEKPAPDAPFTGEARR